jgi:hypothetical protein
MRSAVLGSPVDCKDKFSFVVEETTQLECAGNVAFMQMDYQVSGQLVLEYVIDDVEFETRGSAQSRTGKVRVKPSTITTVLKTTVQRGGDCPQTYDSTRTIPINLKESERSASFQLTIPQQMRSEWSVTPSVTDSRPLLEGPAVLKNVSISSDCDSPPGTHTTETPYKHLEMNTFAWAEQKFSPVCSEESQSEKVFSKTPKFGVTPMPAPSLDCQTNRGTMTYRWERKF